VPWRIDITRTAEKQITKLDPPPRDRFNSFCETGWHRRKNPRQWGKPLRGEKLGLWRYRVGDYRLICHLEDEKVTVLVLEVGHRKDIYR
jgi:mRNA interferase RelE/StbE